MPAVRRLSGIRGTFLSIMKEWDYFTHENGVMFGYFPKLQAQGLRHGISTRIGGCSREDLASLNLGIKVNDNPDNIRVNRDKFCEAVGVDAGQVVASGQIHGDHVAVVDEGQAGQRMEDTDGLVTNRPDLPLLLFFADCVPLLLYDPVRQVIGLSHAGWKGTFLSIGPKTLNVMQHTFGTDPADCLAGIGPSIGPEDYEVDEPVMTEIRTRWASPELFSRPCRPGHWLLNLWEWNRQQLIDAGVPAMNVAISGVSTARQSDLFFSHRASAGKAGRFGVLMSL